MNEEVIGIYGYMAQNLAPQKNNFEITHSATKYGVGRSAC
jgi:hypothetical protein